VERPPAGESCPPATPLTTPREAPGDLRRVSGGQPGPEPTAGVAGDRLVGRLRPNANGPAAPTPNKTTPSARPTSTTWRWGR
jgi:hypothetical protein